ncbi:NAD(P)/FAD-dependent oxidoreductase [Candidatus Omnitrophota bacterium]
MLDFSLGNKRSGVDISQIFDVVVIGAGPSGLTAAIYAGRYRLKTLLIEKELVSGGQLATIADVENYPGYNTTVSGNHLAREMEKQVVKNGALILQSHIESVNFTGQIKELYTPKGVIKTKAVIISTGAQPRMLNIPGEQQHAGCGVSYCATCDGHLYTDKTIAVIGGGNTALEETITLTKYAKKIFLIHRRDEFRADRIIQEKIKMIPKIELMLNTTIKEINFDKDNEKKILVQTKGQDKTIHVDGVFIFVGIIPNSLPFQDVLNLKEGFITSDEDMKTSRAGVFVSGDVRYKSLRQITTAVGDGATAAFSANKYLAEKP